MPVIESRTGKETTLESESIAFGHLEIDMVGIPSLPAWAILALFRSHRVMVSGLGNARKVGLGADHHFIASIMAVVAVRAASVFHDGTARLRNPIDACPHA